VNLFSVPGVISIKRKSGVLVELKRFGKCFIYFDGYILILSVIEDGYLNFYYHDVCYGGDYRFREEFVLSLDEMDYLEWAIGDPGCFSYEDFHPALMDSLYLLLMNN
jgi:hypothetical protein